MGLICSLHSPAHSVCFSGFGSVSSRARNERTVAKTWEDFAIEMFAARSSRYPLGCSARLWRVHQEEEGRCLVPFDGDVESSGETTFGLFLPNFRM